MSSLRWPSGIERTPKGDREPGNQFEVNFRRTRKEIETEMDRLDVDNWDLDHVTGSGGDPGVVLRWTKDGVDYAVWCDGYSTKRANAREIYLWVNETRMRQQRKAETAADDFAAAALPPGDPEREHVVAAMPPHEVLGVQPDAPAAVVKGAYRQLMKEHSPDRGGDPEEFRRINKAKEALLEG